MIGIKKATSVDIILNAFNSTINQLKALSADKQAEADEIDKKIITLDVARVAAVEEKVRADVVAKRLEGLISDV